MDPADEAVFVLEFEGKRLARIREAAKLENRTAWSFVCAAIDFRYAEVVDTNSKLGQEAIMMGRFRKLFFS